MIGDVGKGCIFDISFLNSSFSKFSKTEDNTFDTEKGNKSP